MYSRLHDLRAGMTGASLDALLVTGRENIYYLSGFTGSAGALLVIADTHLLASDFRYTSQAALEAPEWPFMQVDGPLLPALRARLADTGVASVGYDASNLTLAQYAQLGGDDPALPFRLYPEPGLLTAMRLLKSPEELARMRAAVALTDAACADLLERVRVGITERELALSAEWFMRTHGAARVAFDIIVAAGPRSALPHAQPTDRPLRAGDLLVIDMGAELDHYCADMTRTVAVAEAPPRAREIYRTCRQAQQAGVDGIRAGMTGHDADRLCRAVIEDAGYGEYFGHGTGHGVGLAVHEEPRLRPGVKTVLPAGAAVTIEPGIYLPEFGGVRIEDLVVLTADGCEVLTAAPKPEELLVCG
ncbi:MAG: Xaa-Pro dipeptidase [bacterium ADurb.Bin429]|nr:MAG: Xaa-Pro dipeptidase [bacterium ADurb.Bin429]